MILASSVWPVTLTVVFKGPEGIALAVDSRVTLTATNPQTGEQINSYFDNATKLLSLAGNSQVGIVTFGTGAITLGGQPRTAHGFIPEFEERLSKTFKTPPTVEQVAKELGTFFGQQWTHAGMPTTIGGQPVAPMGFFVAGYDDGAAYGRVYEVSVPNAPVPVEQNPNDFGVSLGGQHEFTGRLLSGFDPRVVDLAKDQLGLGAKPTADLLARLKADLGLPIPYQFLPLQDCVDLAEFLVDMTATVQKWTLGVRGVGGDVDVATITRTEGFRAIRLKKIKARE
jgi:hypothetical protein